jgi:hypothetical protein
MPASFRSCCDRRSADVSFSASGQWDCGPWTCRRCLLCVGQCICGKADAGPCVDAGDELDGDEDDLHDGNDGEQGGPVVVVTTG